MGKDKPSRAEKKAEKAERFKAMKEGQQRRILRNNPSAPVEAPETWTAEDDTAAGRRQRQQQDNPPGGRYRHR